MNDIVERLRDSRTKGAIGLRSIAADEIERLREAVYWALGERDDFGEEPAPLAGKYRRRYWWRTELRRRAFSVGPAYGCTGCQSTPCVCAELTAVREPDAP